MWFAAFARRASDAGLAWAVVTSARTRAAHARAWTALRRGIQRSYAGVPPCAACASCIQSPTRMVMDKTGIHPGGEHAYVDAHGHGEHHEELGWWRKYVFSFDHKVIGIQYTITGLLFLLFGFTLMMIMRWQLAFPGRPIPLIGRWLGQDRAPMGIMLPEFYNQLGAMHGTIMVFLGVVPLAVGGFGNFVMPLQIGAPDMAFPKINMASYWVYFLGGVTMLTSFVIRGGAAHSGWSSYPPLSVITGTNGQTMWLIGMIFLITSSLLGSVNFIVTIVQLRAKGLSYMRLPFFVW